MKGRRIFATPFGSVQPKIRGAQLVAAKLSSEDHLYLVDGSGYIFRAYHALPPLTRKSDGLPVGAVQGFSAMLHKLLLESADGDRPTHFAVIFDHSGRSFRNEIYKEYKANRPPAPEDLVPQFPLVRDATRAFGAPAVELEGYEADDLIATYARQAEALGARTTIISSDKDLMQLVGDKIDMLDTMKSKRIGVDEVIEKFGAGPDKVIDIQALAGDSVDNVPGVPGIGVKTAAQLIEDYGDLETLLERAEEIKQNKRRERLIENAEMARVSKELVTLKTDVPVVETLDAFTVQTPDADVLTEFFDEMEFRTLKTRVLTALGAPIKETAKAPAPQAAAASYETVEDLETLETWIAGATDAGSVAVDTETDSLDAMRANLVGVSLSFEEGKACYIPLAHGAGELELTEPPKQIPLKAAVKALKPLLEDPAVLKVGQNIKYDTLVLSRYGISVGPIDDTMLMSFALDAGLHNHGMDELSQLFLDYKPISFSEIAGTGKKQKTFDQIDIPTATKYAAEDADVTLRLANHLKTRVVAEHKNTVYETLERPLVPVLAGMEREGVKVDPAILNRLSSDFAQKMAGFEAEAYELAGEEFNLGSPKQISELLFGKLGLPGGKKTAKGADKSCGEGSCG